MQDNTKKKYVLAEVISVSDKASITQVNFLILCSIKVAVNSWSGGMSSPKSSLAVSATAHRGMALGSLLELHAVRVLGRALPAYAPASANAQILLPS